MRLAANALTDDSDPFALIGFRRVEMTDVGGDRPDHLFVDTFYLQLGVIGHRHRDSLVGLLDLRLATRQHPVAHDVASDIG